MVDLASNASNLGVLLTTGTATDSTAPQVATVSPVDGAVDAPLNTQVWLRFTEPIQTPVLSQFQLTAGGSPVAVLFEISDGKRLVTLRPVDPLHTAGSYTLTVSELEDLAGLPLAGPQTFTFTTGDAADFQGPTYVSLSPDINATGVATGSTNRATFNERINAASVTNANVQLRLGGTLITSPCRAIVTPAAPLLPNSTYQVQVLSETDLVGHTGQSPFCSFVTGS